MAKITQIEQSMMTMAIAEAEKARKRGDYFFGAVVARGEEVLAIGGNRAITKNDPTKHVELEVLQYAIGASKDRYLTGATLYTTCEPCIMCAGASYWAGVERVIWAMDQVDLRLFGERHGDQLHKYRASPFGLTSRWEHPPLFKTARIMRQECLDQLYAGAKVEEETKTK